MRRHTNRGLRKICGCPRRNWPKCAHSWHFNFKVRGGASFRFSVDAEVGEHVDSKTEAEAYADGWRIAIRAGTFVRRVDGTQQPAAPRPEIVASPDVTTLATFGQTYFERRGKPASANDRSCLARFVAFTPDDGQPALGARPIGALTEDVIELFFAQLRREGRAASTRNKYVQMVKAMFRWAVKKGYLARNPVADSETIKREKHAKRNRRLAPDVAGQDGKIAREGEERRLLAVAGPHLQRLIVGALETGMRRGELLNLQWRDVNLTKKEITVRAETTKTQTGRTLPVSTRLAAVLEMAQTALSTTVNSGPGARMEQAERDALMARCYVFGDEAGLRVGNVKRAWETAVLKAHGHTPVWAAGNKLAPTSRAALAAIDLHFHDLRHEAGSRLLEAGWPLHHVQHMLGHANVSQTSTYLNAMAIGLQESMRRFDDARCNPVASATAIEHPPTRNEDSAVEVKTLVN